MLRDSNLEPTSTRPTQETPPSINNELITAREYLRTSEPSTDPHFAAVYSNIQTFINDLASTKELFDIKVYNDVKAMLRVHSERMQDHSHRFQMLVRSPPSSSSSHPSKVFTDDLAYDGPSSASTAASSPFKKQIKAAEEYEQEHPWQEGELLVFEPRPFCSKGPGYKHPAPKAVMGFDPAMGFGRRSITLSEEEMFPGTESAKKRVMDKGFAQMEFAKGPKRVVGGGGGKSEPWVAESKKDKEKGTVEEVRDPNVPNDRVSSSRKLPAEGKGKEKDVLYPDLASSKQALQSKLKASPMKAPPKSLGKPSPKEPTSPKRPNFSKKSIFSGPLPTASTKRPHDEGFIDPITLSNKRLKLQEAENETKLDEPIADYLDSLDAGPDDPAYDTDEIEARRVFGIGEPFDEDIPAMEDSRAAMQIDEPAEVRQFDRRPGSRTELAKTAANARKHGKREAADNQSESEEPKISGFSRFAKAFFQPWRQDDHPDKTDLRTAKQDLLSNSPVSSTNNGQKTPLNNHSVAKQRSIANTPKPGDINDKKYLDEPIPFVPLTSSSPPFTPRSPKPKYLPETEKHAAKEQKQVQKPKPKTPSPKQPSPYGSPPPSFSIVPPTPPTSSPLHGIDEEKAKDGRGSTLPVPFAIPLTPPPSRSSSMNPKTHVSTETPTKTSKQQSEALATLDAAARRYEAAEVAARRAREERDVILKEAKEEERKRKEEQLAGKLKMVEKQREKVRESSSGPVVVDSRLPTPPSSTPSRITTPKAAAPLKSSPRSSNGPPYGHFGLIPREIANAPITYPPPKRQHKQKHKEQSQHTRKHTALTNTPATTIKTHFHPGDPIFLFGETRYLTALKSRQIEKDLASNDVDVQREIDGRPLMGMFWRFGLPMAEGGWMEGVERERGMVAKREREGGEWFFGA